MHEVTAYKTSSVDQFVIDYAVQYRRWQEQNPAKITSELLKEIYAEPNLYGGLITWATKENYLLFRLKWG